MAKSKKEIPPPPKEGGSWTYKDGKWVRTETLTAESKPASKPKQTGSDSDRSD